MFDKRSLFVWIVVVYNFVSFSFFKSFSVTGSYITFVLKNRNMAGKHLLLYKLILLFTFCIHISSKLLTSVIADTAVKWNSKLCCHRHSHIDSSDSMNSVFMLPYYSMVTASTYFIHYKHKSNSNCAYACAHTRTCMCVCVCVMSCHVMSYFCTKHIVCTVDSSIRSTRQIHL